MTAWSKSRIVVAQALCFGLLTGLLEAGLVVVKSQVLGRFVRVGPELAWMAPVADAMVFLAIGLALIGGSYLWAQLGRPMVAPLVLAFFASLSALLMYYPLESYAKFLLAIGLAVQTARVLHRLASAVSNDSSVLRQLR